MFASDEVLDMILASPGAYVMAFLLGALWGSFANVCIARLPLGMSVVRPGSHCFSCQAPVRWYDNFPIVSYFVLRGRCRACKAGYSARYMLVEAATALLFLATYHYCIALLAPGEPPGLRVARFAVYAFFVLAMVVITFIDFDHKLILDVITYPAAPFFFVTSVFLLRDHGWQDALAGVVLGFGVVWVISEGYYRLTKREGMGLGDGKLLAVIGALLGWRAVLFSLFGGSVIGSVIGVAALAIQRRRHPAVEGEPPLRHVEIPFGPFLVAAALVYLFLQQQIVIGFRALYMPAPPEM